MFQLPQVFCFSFLFLFVCLFVCCPKFYTFCPDEIVSDSVDA